MKNEVKFGKHLGIDFLTFWWMFGKHLGIDFLTFWWMLGGKLKEKVKSI